MSKFKTIQIHATQQCNLACKHCYSSSAPDKKAGLDIFEIKNFLKEAWTYGFNNLALSGGEPFLYRHFGELLKFAKDLGYQNTVASNGMLLGSKSNQEFLQFIDLIAISIDGDEAMHDNIRNQKGAYQKMLEGVEVLKKLNRNFGFIHTLTHHTWDKLFSLADFVHSHGAKLFQIHPLEYTGRAIEHAGQFYISNEDRYKAYIMCTYLQSKYQDMIVQLDLLHKDHISEYPHLVNNNFNNESGIEKITDILDTIAINESGDILPFAYGFNQDYTIGSIKGFSSEAFSKFIHRKIGSLKTLISKTYDYVLKQKDDVVTWNEVLINQSYNCLIQ